MSEQTPEQEARELLDRLLRHVSEYVSDYGFNGAIYRYSWKPEAIEDVLAYTASLRTKLAEVEKERDAAVKESFRLGRERWSDVCKSDVFQELKHGKYRHILRMLQGQQISVGKAAQSIAEIAHGCTPRLPSDYTEWVSPDEALDVAVARAEAAEQQVKTLRDALVKTQKALITALDSYQPISEFVSKLADEFDDGGFPEYAKHPMFTKASDIDHHIMGTYIAVEQDLGGNIESMEGPVKTNEIREALRSLEPEGK